MPVIVSVSCHLPGDSGLLTGDDLAARWLAVDCAAPSQPTADILALILAARPPSRPRRSWLTYQEAQSGGRRRNMPSHEVTESPLHTFLRWPNWRSLTLTYKNIRCNTVTCRRRVKKNGIPDFAPPRRVSSKRSSRCTSLDHRTALNHISRDLALWLLWSTIRGHWKSWRIEHKQMQESLSPPFRSSWPLASRLNYRKQSRREERGSDGGALRKSEFGKQPRQSRHSRSDGSISGAWKENGIGFRTLNMHLQCDSDNSGARYALQEGIIDAAERERGGESYELALPTPARTYVCI